MNLDGGWTTRQTKQKEAKEEIESTRELWRSAIERSNRKCNAYSRR